MRDPRLVELEYFRMVAADLYQATSDDMIQAGDRESDDGRGFGTFRNELCYCMVQMGDDLRDLRQTYSGWAQGIARTVVAKLTGVEVQLLWILVESSDDNELPEPEKARRPALPEDGEIRRQLAAHFGDLYLQIVYMEEHPSPRFN